MGASRPIQEVQNTKYPQGTERASRSAGPPRYCTTGRVKKCLYPIQVLQTSSITRTKGEVNQISPTEMVWAKLVIEFLTNRSLPPDGKESRKVRHWAAKLVILKDTLYKKSFIYPLLRCVSSAKGNYILQEVHEGICGNHFGARMVTRKVLRTGYY